MKKVLLMSALTALSFIGFAQDKTDAKPMSFSGGVEIGLPMGDYGDIASMGFGASVQMDYSVASKTSLTANIGYLTFSGKSVSVPFLGTIKYPSTGWIPVLAGVKYQLTDKIYGGAAVGMSFLSASGGSSESAFTYAPTVGYTMNKIDISAKYVSASKDGSSSNFLGIRVAYKF